MLTFYRVLVAPVFPSERSLPVIISARVKKVIITEMKSHSEKLVPTEKLMKIGEGPKLS